MIQQKYDFHLSQTSDIHEHLPTLAIYASKCDHITEMGTRTVVSTWAFLMGNPKVMKCYDLYNTPEIQEMLSVCKNASFHEGDVLQVDIEETDLLFIDTFHCYSQLKAELARHGNKARKYIIFHDTVSYGHKDEIGHWVTPEMLKNYKQEGKQGILPAIEEFMMANPDWYVDRHDLNNNGLMVLTSLPRKAVRNLFTSFYNDQHPQRRKELEHCIKTNAANPLIDHIYVISDEPHAVLEHEKITVINQPRPKYADFFTLINSVTGDHDINIIANTDIHFDTSLSLVASLPNTCLALSRWEGDDLHKERYSQDVWMFQGKIKAGMYSDFYLGIRGCDNRIAFEIKKVGYRIINPALSIKCYHVHKSEVRNYGIEKVPMPYLPVEISSFTF